MTEQLLGWGLALGGGSILAWGAGLAAKKYLIPEYKRRIHNLLAKALNPDTPDPKLNELLRAHALTGAKLAEYLIPDRGAGIKRFDYVDAALAKVHIPAPLRKLLIEEAVYTMDDELKTAAGPDKPT